jgi:hypothetical protein
MVQKSNYYGKKLVELITQIKKVQSILVITYYSNRLVDLYFYNHRN